MELKLTVALDLKVNVPGGSGSGVRKGAHAADTYKVLVELKRALAEAFGENALGAVSATLPQELGGYIVDMP